MDEDAEAFQPRQRSMIDFDAIMLRSLKGSWIVMQNDTASKSIDLELLSVREREVVALTIEGCTDEQIAQALHIGLGTVNTYWVRVRQKLGSYSRTEIVSLVLRHEMEQRIQILQEEIARLKENPEAVSKPLVFGESEGEPWRFLTLGYLSEAAMVVHESGAILYANPPARDLVGASRYELEGIPFWELTFTQDGSSCKQRFHAFFANRDERRIAVGSEVPHFLRRRDGGFVRVTIDAAWFESPDGPIATVSLRRYPIPNPNGASMA